MSGNFITQKLPEVQKWSEVYAWVKGIPSKEISKIINGRMGELIVSYYLHGKDMLDWTISEHSGDGGTDTYIRDKKIQVKTCRFFKNAELKEFLKAKGTKNIYYALVSLDIEKERYKIQGFIKSDNFLTDKYYVKNWRGKGPRYICNARDLKMKKT